METAEVMHHLPGRLRLRLPFAKKNPARLRSIQEALADLPGVRRVDANPTLGSMVVHYDPSLFADFIGALTNYAVQNDLFSLACNNSVPCVSETDRSVNRILGDVNRAVQAATGDIINLKELMPLAVAAYGFLFVNRGAAAAQWVNWLQFAFDTYIDLHEDEPIAEVGEKVETVGAQILTELAAVRAELHVLAERLPAAKEP